MNKVILMGRLGQDPESPKDEIAKFSLATSQKWTTKDGEKKEKTQWHRCVCFGKSANSLVKFLKKGQQLLISDGMIEYGDYTNNDGVKVYTTEVIVKSWEFVDNKPAATNGVSTKKKEHIPMKDDLPF